MRTRIISLAVLSAAVAIVLFGVPLAVVVVQHASVQQTAALERVAEAAALAVEPEVSGDDMPASLPDAEDEISLALYDDHGRRLMGVGPDQADAPTTQAIGGATSIGEVQNDLVVAVPITHDSDVEAVMRATLPRAHFQRDLIPTWLAMLGSAVLALGVVWMIARYQARRLARPLEDLSVDASRLGQGDFSVHVAPVSIREIDSVGAALNSTAQRLDALIARERAFSADASHQLRTPLTAMRLDLETALDKPEAELRSAVSDGLIAADQLEQTINELLALARDADKAPAPMDLGRLMQDIDREWRPRLATAGRRFTLIMDPKLPAVSGSAAAIRQAVHVLLDNAMHHGSGTVHLTVRDAGNVLAFDIADEGSGITSSEEELFGSSSGRSPGHGIGLALARRLVESDGGRLVLTQPRPAIFTLLVPARDEYAPLGARAAMLGSEPVAP